MLAYNTIKHFQAEPRNIFTNFAYHLQREIKILDAVLIVNPYTDLEKEEAEEQAKKKLEDVTKSVCVQTHARTRTHTHLNTATHTYRHTHAHAHTHTHMLLHTWRHDWSVIRRMRNTYFSLSRIHCI